MEGKEIIELNVKLGLLSRGFTDVDLINNRGLIGATIEETISHFSTLHSELEKQKQLYKGLKEFGHERITALEKELKEAKELIEELVAKRDSRFMHEVVIKATTFLNEGKK